MADISKPIYGESWASTGEKLSPDLVKIQGGWIQEMMPFQYENWIQNRQDVAISYLLQKGVVEWTAEQECVANKTVVTYQGNLYMATANTTGVAPTTIASWKRLNGVATADGVIGIAGGGTGATTAPNARTNLGLGTIATQNANAVAITGGAINGTSVGATTPSTGAFTSVIATGNVTATNFIGNITGNVVGNADTVTNGVYTVGNQTIAGNKTFSGVTAVTNATASTNTTTGSLTVAGGVGVVGALNVGGGITGSLSGNATSANTLSTGRTIALSGGVTGTPTSFNGSANIVIPVTSIDASIITGTAAMDISGNAGTATKLQTPRTIALSGAATGTATAFDGSGNISIPVTALNATNLTSGSVSEARMAAFAVTKTGATGSAKLPAGSDAERDASPQPGYFRFNTVTKIPEFWNGTAWMTSTGADLAGLIGTGPNQVPTNAIAGSNYATKLNATLLGTPTAPTAPPGTNTTQLATTAFVQARPAGHLFQQDMWNGTRANIPVGFIPEDGQQVFSATYPDAVAAIRSGKQHAITEAEWQADPLKRNCWSLGDGSTWVRAPDNNGVQPGSVGKMYKAGDGGSLGGTAVSDAIRNITGGIPGTVASGGSGSGAFTKSTNTSGVVSTGTSYGDVAISFDASRVVPTAPENRPKTSYQCYIVRVSTGVSTNGTTDLEALAAEVAGAIAEMGLRQKALGDGQTLQTMGSDRAPGVTYTNSTGRTIFVTVRAATSSANATLAILLNGVTACNAVNPSASGEISVSLIVPDGATYRVNAGVGASANLWRELR